MPVMLKDFEIGDTCDKCRWKINRHYSHPVFGNVEFLACVYSDEVFITEQDAEKMRSPFCPFKKVRYLENDEYANEGCHFV